MIGAADQTTEVYAAARPIAVGEKLTPDKLHRVKVHLGNVAEHYADPQTGPGMDRPDQFGTSRDQFVQDGALRDPA